MYLRGIDLCAVSVCRSAGEQEVDEEQTDNGFKSIIPNIPLPLVVIMHKLTHTRIQFGLTNGNLPCNINFKETYSLTVCIFIQIKRN